MKVEHFKYLDDLRESGKTNMWGARPYLMQAFKLEKIEAGTICSAWMKTFDGTSTPEARVERALNTKN